MPEHSVDDKNDEPNGPTFLPCPFCGKAPDPTDHSTMHPTGTVWRDDAEIGFRTYHSHSERREGDGQSWVFNCLTESGGCGAEIHGDSEGEAVLAWNRRAARVSPTLTSLPLKDAPSAELWVETPEMFLDGWGGKELPPSFHAYALRLYAAYKVLAHRVSAPSATLLPGLEDASRVLRAIKDRTDVTIMGLMDAEIAIDKRIDAVRNSDETSADR